MVIVACLTILFALQGKLHRSFRAWKSFKLKSVRDKTLRDKACDHHNKILLRKAVQAWKGYIHLCFRIKVRDLGVSLLGRLFRPYLFPGGEVITLRKPHFVSSLGEHSWSSPSPYIVSQAPVVGGFYVKDARNTYM